MKNIISGVVTSVVAGVLLYVITNMVLPKKEQPAAPAKPVLESVVPEVKQKPQVQLPQDRPRQIVQSKTETSKTAPRINVVRQEQPSDVKPSDQLKSTERRPDVTMSEGTQAKTEQGVGAAATQARTQQDSLSKEKSANEEVKKVKKRAQDVFEELEEETKKEPPPPK